MWIHEFWLQYFPQFMTDCYFIYYILDFASILIFFKVMFSLPSYLMGMRKRDQGIRY